MAADLMPGRPCHACPPLRGRPAPLLAGPGKIRAGGSLSFERVDFTKFCNPDECYEYGFSVVAVDYFRARRAGSR